MTKAEGEGRHCMKLDLTDFVDLGDCVFRRSQLVAILRRRMYHGAGERPLRTVIMIHAKGGGVQTLETDVPSLRCGQWFMEATNET